MTYYKVGVGNLFSRGIDSDVGWGSPNDLYEVEGRLAAPRRGLTAFSLPTSATQEMLGEIYN